MCQLVVCSHHIHKITNTKSNTTVLMVTTLTHPHTPNIHTPSTYTRHQHTHTPNIHTPPPSTHIHTRAPTYQQQCLSMYKDGGAGDCGEQPLEHPALHYFIRYIVTQAQQLQCLDGLWWIQGVAVVVGGVAVGTTVVVCHRVMIDANKLHIHTSR